MISAMVPLVAGLSAKASAIGRTGETWTFDDLASIGGWPTRSVGAPVITASPWGRATSFDGAGDALLIDRHPLAGARTFTFEALFRPDGGAFQQRWFHLEAVYNSSVAPGTSSTRMLFEIRVVGTRWYLDTFVTGPAYKQALVVPAKTWPIAQWHHVAQSYDGRTYRSFVNGQIQNAVDIAFTPQGPGRCSVGARLNGVDFFQGAVRAAHFSREARAPSQFQLMDAHVTASAADPAA